MSAPTTNGTKPAPKVTPKQSPPPPGAATPAPKVMTPIDDIRNTLDLMDGEFRKALPASITSEKFRRVLVTAITTNPDLLNCTRQSLLASCMKAAQDGLLPDGKEAALIPRKNKKNPDGVKDATYQPMFQGILKKVRNSGELASLTANIVYETDKFRFWTDSNGDNIEHEPNVFGVRTNPIGVYAIAKTKDGHAYIDVMSTAEVMDVKATSMADSGPWNGPFEGEMWKKTVIKRLSKRLPMSTDIADVIDRVDDEYDLKADQTKLPAPEKKKSSRLSDIVDAQFTESKPEQTAKPPNDGDVPI